MVEPVVLSRLFDAHDAVNVFNDTDLRSVAIVGGADVADVMVGKIVTNLAVRNVVSQIRETLSKGMNHLRRLTKQIERIAQSRFSTHARKAGQFLHGFFKKTGRIGTGDQRL